MMFKIETMNPINKIIEYYVVCANSEDDAKIKFTKEFPSNKIREIIDVSEQIIEVV